MFFALAGCGQATTTIFPANPASRAGARLAPLSSSKVDHVVIIIQENRSVDNLFNGLPGADTVTQGKNSEGGYTQLQPVALAARYGEPALGQDWLVRVSAGTAYVLSSPPRGALYVPLWSTSDGGASWAARRIPCGGALSVVASVAPDGALVAVCAGEPGAGSQAKWSAVSTDGGRTWAVHPRCEIIACQPAALVGGYLGEVDAVSASTFYVIGDRSPLIVTRDGGVSWRRYDDVGNVNGLPAQVQFFGPRDGIVLGQSNTSTAPVTIWHTDDAGANWTAVTPTFSG